MESIYDQVREIRERFPLRGLQRVSGNRFEQHMVYVPHGECNCLMLFLLVLIVSHSENLSDVS